MSKLNEYVHPDAQLRAQHQHLVEKEKIEEARKKNFNFVQIEKKAFKALRSLSARSNSAFQLLMVLSEKMNRQNAIVCSYETLTRVTKLGRTTLYKAVKLLKDECWIQIVKVGNANAYIINSKVFWQSHGDKKMTVFHATIMASSEEQDEPIENWDGVELKNFPFLSHTEELILSGEEPLPPNQNEIDFHEIPTQNQDQDAIDSINKLIDKEQNK